MHNLINSKLTPKNVVVGLIIYRSYYILALINSFGQPAPYITKYGKYLDLSVVCREAATVISEMVSPGQHI